MSEVSRAAKVGLMTVALAGALYGGYRFVSRDTGTSGGYRVHAYLPDVTGIAPRSRVGLRLAGVACVSGVRFRNDRAMRVASAAGGQGRRHCQDAEATTEVHL